MYRKLAFKNISKSYRDYMVYFLTLALGVSVFYTFNSIEAQRQLMALNSSKYDSLNLLNETMGYVSIFVSVVLGFSIVYANGFLIKRRTKEFGIYLTLGMKKREISWILVMETSLMAIFAVFTGLTMGVILSQMMSVFTAKLFEVQLKAFTLIFSYEAALKSIVYFGFTFFIVMIANVLKISKVKLIDLIYNAKRNQRSLNSHPFVYVFLFMVSVVFIGVAYFWIIKYGLFALSSYTPLSFFFGTVGTFLFFFSFANGLQWVAKKLDHVYYKDLNVFLVKQFSSKVNTNFVSMAMITLMLLLAMGTFTTGISLGSVLASGLNDNTPYDISITVYMNEEKEQGSPLTYYESQLSLENVFDTLHETLLYRLPMTYSDLYDTNLLEQSAFGSNSPVDAISLSAYNQLAMDQGQGMLHLGEGEVGLMVRDALFSLSGKTLTWEDHSFTCVHSDAVTRLSSDNINSYIAILVMPDEALSGYTPVTGYINGNYSSPAQAEDFESHLNELFSSQLDAPYFAYYNSKASIIESTLGTKAVVSFIGIYVGIVFLITSAAVLSLQQLTETIDNREHYKVLSKIGADQNMMRKALFKQVFSYFAIPMALALVHTYVGMTVVGKIIRIFGEMEVIEYLLPTLGVLIIVYGVYFVSTYQTVRYVVLNDRMD